MTVRSPVQMNMVASLLLETAKSYMAAEAAFRAFEKDRRGRKNWAEELDKVYAARRALEDAIATAEKL